MVIDLSKYISERGFLDIETLLRDHGYINKDDILEIRIDTTAIAQILKISNKTLRKYVDAGYMELDNSSRMRLGDALKLNYHRMKEDYKMQQPFKKHKTLRNVR